MKKSTTFEQAMIRLDEIVIQLDRSDTTLDKSLALFSEGAELVHFCNKKLQEAQLKIETLFPNTTEKEDEQ